jgi:hypothetical protein
MIICVGENLDLSLADLTDDLNPSLQAVGAVEFHPDRGSFSMPLGSSRWNGTNEPGLRQNVPHVEIDHAQVRVFRVSGGHKPRSTRQI